MSKLGQFVTIMKKKIFYLYPFIWNVSYDRLP